MELTALSIPQLVNWTAIRQEQRQDEECAALIGKLDSGEEVAPGFSLHQDHLCCYQGGVVVPRGSPWIRRMLHEFHDSALGGHSGFLRTYKRVANNLFWMGMKGDIHEYVANCSVCQRSKSEPLVPAGLLQPLPIPARV